MQSNNLPFKVSSARLTPSGRFVDIIYKDQDSDTLHPGRISAQAFEHYLKSMHDVECRTLAEWITHSKDQEVFTRIAAYMQCMQWERDEQESAAAYEHSMAVQ